MEGQGKWRDKEKEGPVFLNDYEQRVVDMSKFDVSKNVSSSISQKKLWDYEILVFSF